MKKRMRSIFRDTQFMSAKEKELVLKAWKTFIVHGMQFKHFTKRLYAHLSLRCEFIAHYNKHGFYDVYFASGSEENTRKFLRQFNRILGDGKSVEYGLTHWLNGDYTDINSAMCEVVERYETELDRDLRGSMRKRDIALARRLLSKHGIACELIY